MKRNKGTNTVPLRSNWLKECIACLCEFGDRQIATARHMRGASSAPARSAPAVWQVAVLLLLLPGLLATGAPAVSLPRDATSDDIWAQAIVLSLTDPGVTAAQVERLYLAAVEKAENKAPVLISLGDFWNSPRPRMTEEIALDPDHSGEAMRAAMDLYERKALDCYRSAAEVDSNNALAWFRIAITKLADDALRARARRRLAELEPTNALSGYLQAEHDLRSGLSEWAVGSIENANRFHLRFPPPAVPKEFSLRFPSHDVFAEQGLAGRPVTKDMLALLVSQLESWAQSEFPSARGLSLCLESAAREAEDIGNSIRAMHNWESVARLSLRFIQHEGDRPDLRMGAILSARHAVKHLRPLYERLDRPAKLATLDDFARRIDDCWNRLSARYALENEDFAETPRVDYQAIQQLAAEAVNSQRRILNETGLDTFELAPP